MTTVTKLISMCNTFNSDTVCAVSKCGEEWKMSDIYIQSFKVAKSLTFLGLIPRYESASVFCWNSPEWIVSTLGTIFAGGRACSIHFNSTKTRCEYILNDSNSRVIFVDTKERLNIALETKNIKAIVIVGDRGDLVMNKPKHVYTWKQFIELGSRIRDDIVMERINAQKVEDCAMLVYTSGTTGNPKGVMLSHDNITWTAKAHMDHNPIFSSEAMRVLSFLPLSHIASIMFDMFVPFTCMTYYNKPATIYFTDSSDLSIDDLKRVKPTVIFAVPRTWEKLSEKVREIDSKMNGVLHRLFKNICLRSHKSRQNGKGAINSLVHTYMNFFIKRKIGLDKVQLCFTGAASPNLEVVEYFSSLGVDIVGAYGMSELSGSQCYSKPDNFIDGYSGLPVPGTQVRVDKDTRELCFRGRQVMMGYYGYADSSIDEDGWFHTGDIGEIHESGHIKVTGRIDDLIVTAYGMNIMPTPIETYLKEKCEDIENVVLVGDNQKCLGILVSISPGGNISNIHSCLKDYNSSAALTRSDKIRHIYVIKEKFTIEGGELTPTGKICRSNIIKKYENEIKSMYLDFD